MGKSKSAKMDVTDYYMSLHFGIACGPADKITAITVNEKVMWQGSIEDEAAIDIYQPNLFGGPKKEGGAIGTVHFLPGGATQVMPEHLAAKLGRTTATCPAYRGIASIFFHGVARTYNPFDPSSGYDAGGFNWSSNNPIIAQSVSATLQRAPRGLDPLIALIGSDANPAHMVYECLTDTDWGLGLESTLIDTGSFSACATALYDEAFGLSMIWTKQAKVEDFIGEILDHIQGNFYINPRTGLYTLSLIRDDYNPAELRVMDPDNADLTNFQRKMWGETVTEIAVTWTNPANEQEETVTLQNLAAVSAQGAPVPDSRNYYGVRNSELASRLAARDLRVSSAPLATMEVELDRTAWDLLPGEVVRVNWPEYDLADMIMRVGTVDYGKVGDPTIRATLLEDVFSLEKPTTATQPDTNWTRPGELPAPMAHAAVITLPQYFVSSTDLQATTFDLTYPEVVAAVLAHQTGYDTPTYELLSEETLSNGDTGYRSIGTKSTIDRIVTADAMAAEATTVLPGEDVAGVLTGPQVGGFVFIGDAGDTAMEIAMVDSYDGFDWTLARGVLDTVPKAWVSGTPLWFVNRGSRLTDDQDIRAVGEAPEYKLQSRTSLGLLAEADATVVTGTMTARPHMPLRPANVKVNGQAFGSVAIGSNSYVTVTWANRNRMLEDGQVVRWGAATVAPEYAQETVVSVYDQGGALVYEQGSLWTETSLALPVTYFDRYSAITVQVRSRRDGLWSLQSHSIGVSGLANNPAAAVPPAPPAVTPPPATVTAPGSGVFAATGTAVSNASGASTPTVLITGTPDNTSATGLLIRYKKTGSSDYTFHPVVALDRGGFVRVAVSPLAALTDYIFELAYEVPNSPLGAWRALSAVTTGSLVSSDVLSVAGRDAAQVLLDIDSALAASNGSAIANLQDLSLQNASALILQARDAMTEDVHRDELDYYLGEPVATLALRIQQVSIDGLAAEASERLLLAAHVDTVEGDFEAAILAEQIVRADADSAEAAARLALAATVESEIADVNAAILAEQTVRADADSAEATARLALAATVDSDIADVNAAIVAEQTVRADADSAEATARLALAAHVDTVEGDVLAAISDEASTRASAISAEASSRETLAAVVDGHGATITTQGDVIADISGKFYARAVLEANADGVITGIYAVASNGTAGVPFSAIKLRADKLAVVSSDETATKYPFVYDAVLGKLILNDVIAQSANIGDLAVTTLKIGDLAITAEKIGQGQVIQQSLASSSTAIVRPVDASTVIGVDIDLVAGEKVDILFTCDIAYPSARNTITFQLNESLAGNLTYSSNSYDGQDIVASIMPWSYTATATRPHSFYVWIQGTSLIGGAVDANLYKRVLKVNRLRV